MIPEQHYIVPGSFGFRAADLDALLQSGYYRMQHMVFTTHETGTELQSQGIPVFWLRSKVNGISATRTATGILKKCSRFSTTVTKAEVSIEAECLYYLYSNHIDFCSSPTCYDFLHQAEFDNPFDSLMIEVRDEGRLIAAGYFDQGTNSIAGILNFYHPGYKKYSLGKYLMLKKIEYARRQSMQYYYTGYISTAVEKFDYKLFPDINSIEVYLPVEKTWIPYAPFGKEKLREYLSLYKASAEQKLIL